ncbi:MAG: sugar ABC transporter permease, partial [Pseudoruegeria sp.]
MNPALLGLMTVIVGVSACLGYFYFSNLLLDKVIFPPKAGDKGRNITRANMVRPWLFLFPAMFALGLYLGYPVIETLRLSLTDRSQDGAFVGLANYEKMFSEPKFWEAMRNNMLWLVVVPAGSTAFGLLAAQLTDRISWGNIAKSLIFMPMAISFVGASVIFKLVYDTRPVDQEQIGILNAVWLNFEGGFGTTIALKIIPTLLMLAFVAMVAYAVNAVIAPLRSRYAKDSSAAKILCIIAAGLGVGLIIKTLISVFQLLTTTFTYGEPQTWLTIPFWNSIFLMIVLIWIQTG